MKLGKLRFSYFNGIDRAIESLGHPLIVSRVHPTGSIERRARQLKETIERQAGTERVVVFAHSMGGLDARYMISRLGMGDRVSALVTISTPHHGSSYADWCLEHLGRKLGGLSLAQFLKLDVDALTDLTRERCERFNRDVPNHPDVRYFSIAAFRPWHLVPPFLMHSHKIVSRQEGRNDGIVSVRSARWGESLGTWSADHLHVINRRMVVEIRSRTGNVVNRYLKILEHLEHEGLCISRRQDS